MKNKKLLAIFGLVAIGAIVFLLSIQKIRDGEAQLTPTPEMTKSPVVSKKPTTQQKAELYTDLVKQYEGRRIQFDINCQAVPGNVTYKTGTKIMLDNRSGDARYVSVGGVSYYLEGYGYKILTLTSTTLPKTLYLNCGSGVNVGQILLQK